MFSGIIEVKSKITEIKETDFGKRISLSLPQNWELPNLGASIAVNGACLTVVEANSNMLSFDVVHETLKRTNLNALNLNSEVNVERSLKVGDRIDGHFVSGHIDTTTVLMQRVDTGSIELIFQLSSEIKPYVVHKGSITISGVSLTVGEVTDNTFSVYIIPHTAAVTTLGTLQKGDLVNIEIDMLARYIVEKKKAYERN